MIECTSYFNAPAIAVQTRFARGNESITAAWILRNCVRFFAVSMFGCFLLISLVVFQVFALELSDRVNVFPLYGFFTVNFLFTLLFISLVFVSRRFSKHQIRNVDQQRFVSPSRIEKLWDALHGNLSRPIFRSQSTTTTKPVAVLLIIKRKTTEKSATRSHVASA